MKKSMCVNRYACAARRSGVVPLLDNDDEGKAEREVYLSLMRVWCKGKMKMIGMKKWIGRKQS